MKSMAELLPLLPLLFLSACGPTTDDSQAEDLASLIQAERTFAHTSVTSGTRAAFLEFFAADGVVFDAGPVNAHEVWEQRPAEGPMLAWGPEIADVSEAGDMGYTSGPYEVRMTPDADAVAWGHFISVWRRDAGGTWRVAADGGVAHGPATLGADSVVERAGGGAEMRLSLNEGEIDAAAMALRRYDEAYSRSVAENGFVESLDDFVHRSARFFRNGHHPIVGRETIANTPAVVDAVWSDGEMSAAIISDSGDLGCTYGIVEAQAETEAGSPLLHASYYRIWKQQGDSRWRVVVDVLIPIAPTGG
jgi:ketosteroid isomerase-like protein